jgi:phosphoglycerate dehydrogenase-like enzyme
MRLLAFSPHAGAAQAEVLGVRLTSLEEVLGEADFVSLHARLTPERHGMIGARELALMKPTAYFVNVARGELVDQAALAAALRAGRIAGAALDVFAIEPLPLDDPLLALENVILTPHWSASTREVWEATGRAMAEGMLRAARGEVPENVVDPEVLARPGFRSKLDRFAVNRPGCGGSAAVQR